MQAQPTGSTATAEAVGLGGGEGMAADGEGAMAMGVTVSRHGRGLKGVAFIGQKAEEGRPGCTGADTGSVSSSFWIPLPRLRSDHLREGQDLG